MRIFNLLLTATLVALLGGFSSLALAASDAIKVTSIAQTEIGVTDKNGKKILKRAPVDKAVPGDEVIYTTTFKNIINIPVNDIVINNPIPNNTEYKAGSAFGKNSEILFSVDGNVFAYAEDLKIKGDDGKERIALPKEYTHIRWNYTAPLAAGKSAEVGFRAVIK